MHPADDLLKAVRNRKFATVLADPPWQFKNRTGKVAPEHKRLSRYPTLSLDEIKALPVKKLWSKQHICIYGYPTLFWRKDYK